MTLALDNNVPVFSSLRARDISWLLNTVLWPILPATKHARWFQVVIHCLTDTNLEDIHIAKAAMRRQDDIDRLLYRYIDQYSTANTLLSC